MAFLNIELITMTEFWDFALAPFRSALGPVYDAYRKKYDYKETAIVPGHLVSTIDGTPVPDVAPDRNHNFYYSVYGPPDAMVKADIVGTDAEIRMQSKAPPPVYARGETVRKVEWLPDNVEMHETFVEMPFTQKTKYRASTVATRHS